MNNERIINGQAILEIDLETPEMVDILFTALEPETVSVSTDRAQAMLSKNGSQLIITIQAGDLTALRAAMNSYLAWVSASMRAVESVTDKPPS
ncbi:MAG: KEOPS complex subunit Pcc1 [Candidatus Thorarchaeota archaeon]|nr:KEOPS complex subunit Pcc1 [Candidatus Thorarchaeota archaeon]